MRRVGDIDGDVDRVEQTVAGVPDDALAVQPRQLAVVAKAAQCPVDARGSKRDRGERVRRFFIATAVLLGVDLLADLHGSPHLTLELAAALVALSGVVVLWVRHSRERRALAHARTLIRASRADAERWRKSARAALEGLASAIDTQFAAWGLTPAERELGFLLLKGLSLREAAAVLGKSERTVRQQSLGIYKKGGLAGRAELSAFFLEDLLAHRSGQTSS